MAYPNLPLSDADFQAHAAPDFDASAFLGEPVPMLIAWRSERYFGPSAGRFIEWSTIEDPDEWALGCAAAAPPD